MTRITRANIKMPLGLEPLGATFDTLLRYIEQLMSPVLVTLTYSAAMSVDVIRGDVFEITATNGTAFTINNPANAKAGKRISVTVRNASGGALGVATWGANYRMAAWTQPGNGNSRTIDFICRGTLWIEASRTTSDVPN